MSPDVNGCIDLAEYASLSGFQLDPGGFSQFTSDGYVKLNKALRSAMNNGHQHPLSPHYPTCPSDGISWLEIKEDGLLLLHAITSWQYGEQGVAYPLLSVSYTCDVHSGLQLSLVLWMLIVLVPYNSGITKK